MITGDIAARQDLELVIGQPVPSRVVLPLPEFDGVDLDVCSIRRHVDPAPEPARDANGEFAATPAAPRWVIPEPPKPADVGPPLAPRAFTDWLIEQLPKHGSVEAVGMSHPAFSQVLTAAREGMAKAPANAGANLPDDVSWAVLLCNVEHVVRRCALPADVAFALLNRGDVPEDELRARIAEASASGVSRPGSIAREIIETFEAERDAARQAREREEAERRREVEPIEVDLAEAVEGGLCEFTSDDSNPLGPRCIFRAGGLPIGDVAVVLVFRGRDGVSGGAAMMSAMCRVRSVGPATMTRREQREAGIMPEELALAIRQARARAQVGHRAYASSDFTGDSRTVEGRTALVDFRARAALLVDALASAHGELAAYTYAALMTLPVAYGGQVSLPNAIDSIQEALRGHARRRTSITTTYGRFGLQDATVEERPWPTGLLTPDAVPRETVRALGAGNVPWTWGELLRSPSPGLVQRVKAWLDPGAFERCIAEAIGDAQEVRFQVIVDRLYAEGLMGSTTASVDQRRRIVAALEAAGFEPGEGRDEGRRYRAWRRRAA